MRFSLNILTGIVCIAVCILSSCKKTEDVKASVVKLEKVLTDKELIYPYNRVKIVHLYRDTVYVLAESFARQDGEQLIIDEGTVIKINTGGAVISININAGGVIQANGTKNNPIVFTSNVYPGNQFINWGGLIIQGKASDNAFNSNGDAADFSGTLNYVRVEFAPIVLTAVGNRTILENIMVSYVNQQGQTRSASSFEIDGGNFNAANLVSYACGGPSDFYITRGYSGRMQNILVSRHPFFGSPGNNIPPNSLAGIFIENNPSSNTAVPHTYPIISNATVIGPDNQAGSSPSYMDTTLRSAALVTAGNALFRIRNSLFLGFPRAAWYIDDSLTALAVQSNQSEFTYSIVHSNDSADIFSIRPEAYFMVSNKDFKDYMLQPAFNNERFLNVADFMFTDPFKYDQGPDFLPFGSSPVLTGANFDGTDFGDVFFNKVNYRGALGMENWLQGWTNFTPLKTNYNFEN